MKFYRLKKLSGDASFRSFSRKKNFKKSSVIVYCEKEKENNLVIYDAINNILIKNNLLAPKLISQNYSKNYIEIEDFGDLTLLKHLRKKKINKLNCYKKLILILNQLQKIKIKKFKLF